MSRLPVLSLLALAACGSHDAPTPQSLIKHLVVVVQENHTFDNHFGRYCTAAPGSNPTCTTGPACCEAAPAMEPSGAAPIVLDDTALGAYDPDHQADCETKEIDGGKMDQFVAGTSCSEPQNFALSDPAIVMPYWSLAQNGAIADHYFQPVIGQSSSNDMFLARADFVFLDNSFAPNSIGYACGLPTPTMDYTDPNIGDLLDAANATWAFYADGYDAQKDAIAMKQCASPPADCGFAAPLYPCVYDPSDNPFAYYPTTRDKPDHSRDYSQFATDLAAGTLPQVSFVKAIGYKTEHPGYKSKLSDGVTFVTGLLAEIAKSQNASDTLVIVTYDEGGGYFDHVAPPASPDEHPYGTRVPTIAVGPFVKVNEVSHTQLEHSSIVKFIEWNWLGATGQLHTRDATVANLGSLLDASKTGVAVPE